MVSNSDRQNSDQTDGTGAQSVRNELDYPDNYESASGQSGGEYGGTECCPLVVDSLCLAAILSVIAGATVLLMRVIQIELTMLPRRRRRLANYQNDGLLQHLLRGER